MRGGEFLDKLTWIDEELIEEADRAETPRSRGNVRREPGREAAGSWPYGQGQ